MLPFWGPFWSVVIQTRLANCGDTVKGLSESATSDEREDEGDKAKRREQGKSGTL